MVQPRLILIVIRLATVAFSEFENKKHERLIRRYLETRRPPPHIRNELDLGYRQTGQSIELFEIRPQWRQPEKQIEHAIAKTTYVKSKKKWRIYWQRADLKWHRYEPVPDVSSLEKFIEVVDGDEYGCFYG